MDSDGTQENIRGWLFCVAHNQARNRQTSYHRRFSEPLDGEMDFLAEDATPEQRVLEKEKFRRLATEIRLLTKPERDGLVLRAGGLRHREIGHVLGRAPSAARHTHDHAIQELAEKCKLRGLMPILWRYSRLLTWCVLHANVSIGCARLHPSRCELRNGSRWRLPCKSPFQRKRCFRRAPCRKE